MTPVYYGPQSYPLQNRQVGDFVSAIIWGEPERVKDYCSMAVIDNHEIVAGTLYHNWQPHEGVIELTSATTTPRWLTRKVIKAMFSLPFDVLGCQMCVLRVSERNERMVKIARKFGFSEYIIPRLRGRDEAEIIFTLTNDQWAASPYNKEPANG